jgi:hypothetical protein
MEINDADVAELVDARDLKSPGATEITHLSDLTRAGNPHEAGGDPAVLSNTRPASSAGWQALENVGRRLLTDIDKLQEGPMQITSVASNLFTESIVAHPSTSPFNFRRR